MPKLTLQERDHLMKRRDIVTSLWARGMSQREIVAAMANPNNPASFMLNPDTGKPYELATINRDIRFVRARHESNIEKAVEEHKAQQMVQVNELLRAAWAKKDLKAVEGAIKLKMQLTGTVTNQLDVNVKRKPASAEGLSDEELEKLITESLAARRGAGTTEAAPGTDQPA